MEESIESELVLFSKDSSIDNITHNIYVGNYAASSDKKLLSEIGITHILISGVNMKAFYPDNFIYKTIGLYDSEYTKITKYFSMSNEFIDEGNRQGKILVHCGAGISRSVSLVLAYMINNMKIPFSEAVYLLKSKRKVANPNPGFEKELRNYSYEILKKF